MYRVGIFLLVISGLLLVILAITILNDSPSAPICFGALLCLVFGAILAIRYRPKVTESARFQAFNKFRSMTSKKK